MILVTCVSAAREFRQHAKLIYGWQVDPAACRVKHCSTFFIAR